MPYPAIKVMCAASGEGSDYEELRFCTHDRLMLANRMLK